MVTNKHGQRRFCLAITLLLVLKTFSGTPLLSSIAQQHCASGFIENKGQIKDQFLQTNDKVKYLYNSPGFNVQLRSTGFSYDTYRETPGVAGETPDESNSKYKSKATPPPTRNYHRVDIELAGSNPGPEIIASGKSTAFQNYITPGQDEKGISNVHDYREVLYKNVYPKIDLRFHLKTGDIPGNKVEYDFIIHPGADASRIKLVYNGANKTSVEGDHLKIEVATGIFNEAIPHSFLKGSKREINVSYKKEGINTFSFSLPEGSYDSDLIIDPGATLLWCTYYGGSGQEGANSIAANYLNGGIALDGTGNVYVTGYTLSGSNIATSGAYQSTYAGSQEPFMGKFNSTGTTLLWGTYINGGTCGVIAAAPPTATGIACDPSGNVYVTGILYNGQNVFVVKFSGSGSLGWSTTTGTNDGAFIFGGPAIAVDASGNVFITGSNGVAYGGCYFPWYTQGFICKYSTTGTQQWLHEVGPLTTSPADVFTSGTGIALDASDNIYITGMTSSASGIATSGTYMQTYGAGFGDEGGSAYVARFDSSGTQQWGTYYAGIVSGSFGGVNNLGASIAVDNTGVYITGVTCDNSGVATSGTYKPAFSGSTTNANIYVAKFSLSGTLDWGTYYGGAGGAYETDPDAGEGIVTDGNGNVYVTGSTTSASNIASSGAYQSSLSGTSNAFLANFNASNGTLTWGTYIHGSSSGATAGTGITQKNGKVYIVGETTESSGFSTAGSWQPTYGGSTDVFVASFSVGSVPLTASINSSPPGCNAGSNGSVTVNPSGGTPSYTYLWSPGGQTSQTITGLSAGTYIVTVTDSVHATFIDSVSLSQPQPVVVTASQDTSVCSGQAVTLMASASGGTPAYTYKWSPSIGLNDSTGSTVTAIPNHTISYSVTGSDTNSCHSIPKTVTITVVPLPVPGIISAIPDTACYAATAHLTSSAISADQIQWQYLLSGTGYITISGADSSGYITPSILQATGYRVVVNNGSCSDTSSGFILNVRPSLPPPSLSASDTLICSNDSARIQVITSYSSYRWNDGDTTNYTYVNAAGDYRVTVTNANGCIAVSNNQNISVYPVPSVSISIEGDTLTSLNSGSFQWLFNNSPIPGATSAIYVAQQSGYYSVMVTDTNGCKVLSSNTPVGITDISSLDNKVIDVYPDPFSGIIFIRANNAESIEVFNAVGQIVLSKKVDRVSSGSLYLNTDAMPAGVYYVKVKINNIDYGQKLIKQ